MPGLAAAGQGWSMSNQTVGGEQLVLTRRGLQALVAEHTRLTDVKRPVALAALREAGDVAGDLVDNPGFLQARDELDRIEARIELLEARLRTARRLSPSSGNGGVVSPGMHVVLEDLDKSTCADYVLVASAESDPEHGRLSDESPVGRAISGHRKGDVVDARAPHRIRHLRIAEVDRRRR
jgi:transcription elongation factor GreA